MNPGSNSRAPQPAWQLRRAAHWLRRGGVVAYPTEAVFGLGCDPRHAPALRRLLALKQRDWRKGLILIAAQFTQLEAYLEPQSAELEARALARWPGATTWLWPARPGVSPLLRGQHRTLAVRIPGHPVARALSQALGHPLVSTSANRAGQHPARSALEVRRKLCLQKTRVPLLILHGEVNRSARPSRILDLLTGQSLRS